MKYLLLTKTIANNGAYKLRDGANHEVWIAKNGSYIYIPRHKNIDEKLANSIIKQSKS